MADKVYGTSKGRPVDDSEIDLLVAEAEDGYDKDALRRRGGRRPMGSGPADVVPVRLDPELKSLVESRAALSMVSEICPGAVSGSARWWPSELPSGGQ